MTPARDRNAGVHRSRHSSAVSTNSAGACPATPGTTTEVCMDAVTRSVLEMLVRVLNWLTAHPDDEPGMIVLTTSLRTVVLRMTQVIDDQRKGQIDSRAASVRKQELRRAMLADPIAHLSRIGKLAGREVHELR